MRYPQDDPQGARTTESERHRQGYVRIDETKFWRSFAHAFDGIIHATRTQPNMRVHFVIAALVLLATLVLRLERPYVIATVAFVALVLSMELMNTAIESIVDLLTASHHPLAKTAKDAAAGAVLVAATGAAVGGYLIFYQGLIGGGQRVFEAVQQVPANLALIVVAVVGIATIVLKARFGRGTPLQGGAVSGHASLAFAIATLLALLYRTPLAAALGYFVAFLVAQTRVEARIHSAFEVLWGAILGTTVALAIYVLVRPHVVL